MGTCGPVWAQDLNVATTTQTMFHISPFVKSEFVVWSNLNQLVKVNRNETLKLQSEGENERFSSGAGAHTLPGLPETASHQG